VNGWLCIVPGPNAPSWGRQKRCRAPAHLGIGAAVRALCGVLCEDRLGGALGSDLLRVLLELVQGVLGGDRGGRLAGAAGHRVAAARELDEEVPARHLRHGDRARQPASAEAQAGVR
jgi:hypothetical protein